MKRLTTFLILFLCVSASLREIGAAESSRPNVLFVIVDDLNCRIASYGDPVAKTPHLDRLAARGVRFDRAYCNFPLCNPSRSSVLSGQFPTTTGVLDNKTWLVPPDGHPTLPQHFQKHGYSRAEFGKIWHEAGNNGEIDPANYHHYRADPPPDSMVEALRRGANTFGPVPVGSGTPDITQADEAIRFLKNHDASEQPFFLAVGFQKPHVPLAHDPAHAVTVASLRKQLTHSPISKP
jgi:arylsulfatase A-like enzyme